MTSLFSTPHALIQAPMAGAQDEALAMAVSRCGGLGSVPAAMLSAAQLHDALLRVQAQALPVNVNFFCHTPPAIEPAVLAAWQAQLAPYAQALGLPYAPDSGGGRRPFDAAMAEVLETFSPRVVSFHFGLPAPDLLARVKARGSVVMASATTLREGLWLQAHGADVVIAQGLEAGGHRGHFLDTDPALQSDTRTLLAQLVSTLRIPVVAAGGIAAPSDVAEVMALGAAAVQVGTAFLCCDEARTSALHRARLLDLDAPTALTNLFSGGLARGLINRLMDDLGPIHSSAPPFPLASAALAPLRAAAEAQGRDDFTPLWSGTRRQGCAPVPAAQIVDQLMVAA